MSVPVHTIAMKLPIPLLLCCLFSAPLQAQIHGRVFADQNANGQFEPASEKGLARISVRLYDRLGQEVARTLTDSSGSYQFTRRAPQPLRLQFTDLPAGYYPTGDHRLVRFVRAASEACMLGIYQPHQFVGTAPQLAVSVQPLGNHGDPRADSLDISTIRLLATGTADTATRLRVAPAQTGAIWGLAYDPARRVLYAAALAKRHSGFGPLGSGGLYQTDVERGTTTPLVSLDALGVPTGPARLTRDLTAAYEGRMNDSLMYGWVGKMGLGGVDLSADGRVLYTVNLFDQKLYALRLGEPGAGPTAADLTRYELPRAPCRGGAFRPFALKVHEGQVFVGGVCDAQQSGKAADLRGLVYAIDPVTKEARTVLDMPLNYQRGAIESGVGNWFAWTDEPRQVMLAEPAWWAVHPQPILSDIEFTTDGSLLIGFMDRLGHQMATGKGSADGRWPQTVSLVAGDVLQASPKQKHFRLEANARAGARQSAGGDNQEGPAGGEFYYQDAFSMGKTHYHQENGMGGLALLPGDDQLLVSSREPVAEYNSAGVVAYDSRTGGKTAGLVVYHHNPAVEYVGRKTNHVGDVEIVGSQAPTLLGHRVWQDCNENGIQDADEPGLPAVQVELWDKTAGQRVATTQTDSAGQYSFDSRFVEGGLQPATAYELRVPYQQARYGQLALALTSTTALAGLTNNDAEAAADYALIQLRTTAAGENQLALDFGFRCVDKPQAVATLRCSGDQLNAQITLALTSYQADERYDLSLAQTYAGQADYTTAESIPAGGQVFTKPLAALTENDLTVRVFKAGGCYQDLSVTVARSAECVRLLTSPPDASDGLQVSPNPTHDKVRLQYATKSADPVTLQLVTANGRQLQRDSVLPSSDGLVRTMVDLSHYAPGLYVVSLQQGSVVVTRKIIRQ